jgi:hypothetical protein
MSKYVDLKRNGWPGRLVQDAPTATATIEVQPMVAVVPVPPTEDFVSPEAPESGEPFDDSAEHSDEVLGG